MRLVGIRLVSVVLVLDLFGLYVTSWEAVPSSRDYTNVEAQYLPTCILMKDYYA